MRSGNDLTIVIVNWNGGQLLMRCLESIRAFGESDDVAVIVVDNNSTDGSREAAIEAFPKFRVINSGSNMGFGRANNLARKLVDTSLVLFLNPDTELMDGALDRTVQCLDQHPEVGALGCRILDAKGMVQELGLQWSMTPWTALLELLIVTDRSRHYMRRWLPTIDPHHSCYVRKIYGGFMMVRRDVLEAADWFDERYFMYAEDADLSRTIRALGWKLYYCSEAVIMHVGGGTTPSGFSYLMKQESINKLIYKYQGSMAAMLHRAVVFVGGLLRLSIVRLAGLIAMMRKDGFSAASWNASCLKQKQLMLWSLGLRKPQVPVLTSTRLSERTIE